MSKNPKICTDCRYLTYPVIPAPGGVQCAHPNNLGDLNLVNGSQPFNWPPIALRARDALSDQCGPEGRWFAPKRPTGFSRDTAEQIERNTAAAKPAEDTTPPRKHWWQTLIGG